jgi:hypothetical protein
MELSLLATTVGVALVMVKAFAGSPITMVPSAKHPVAVSVTRTTYVPTAKVNVFQIVSMFCSQCS